MKFLPTIFTFTAIATTALGGDKLWITNEGKAGPGKGKHIVFLSGDEEYRSEEGLPQLAKILSERHGFKTTVLFSINLPGWSPREIADFKKANPTAPEPKPTDTDPNDGTIDPNEPANEPGMEALDSADLCVMLLRFRRWPDEQMKHFADYVAAGKPVIGLRTSTHAFSGIKGTYSAFNGFGKNVLGEGWVNHWGKHKSEATRGVIEPGAKGNPLLRGVADLFGDTDVYEAYPPADAQILVRGQVLKGMTPDAELADYKKNRATDKVEQGINDPAMPVVWTREVKNEAGTTNKTLCSTMGSATDLKNEGLRRLVVNTAYAFTGLEVPAAADVTLVGEFKPSFYGFGGFIPGVKPADLAGK
ncbi:MAG: hypothetical protein WCF18_07120 [Chthoniobacteraceae bacterium]